MTKERHEWWKHTVDCLECKRLTRGYTKKTGKIPSGGVWSKASQEHAHAPVKGPGAGG